MFMQACPVIALPCEVDGVDQSAHVLMGQDISSAAGHLLDPNMEVGTAISRGLQPLMHDWCSRGNIAKDLTCSILAPMFLRLASNHEELLAYEPGVQESADVVQPEQAELVWQLIVGEPNTEECTFLLVFFSEVSRLHADLYLCPVVTS
jgi:hypothetical protein